MTEPAANLIPFGLRASDGVMVDCRSVPRGRECGCVCPSCGTPLIARQGKEKAWHFAHASRHVFEHTAQTCDFSFYVSVRMMARQLIGEELTLVLPDFDGYVERHVPELAGSLGLGYHVTRGRRVHIDDVQVESRLAGVPVDLLGRVKGFELAAYLEHAERNVPPELLDLDGHRAGVIAIDLGGVSSRLTHALADGADYLGVLADFLQHDIEFKRWVYHPKQAVAREQAEQKLDRLISEAIESRVRGRPLPADADWRPDPGTQSRPATVHRTVRCRCAMCGSTWDGELPGLNFCPKCGTHLYTRVG